MFSKWQGLCWKTEFIKTVLINFQVLCSMVRASWIYVNNWSKPTTLTAGCSTVTPMPDAVDTLTTGCSTVTLMTDAVDTVTWAPDDGWRYHPTRVKQFTDINKLYIVASCWTIIDKLSSLLGRHYVPTDTEYRPRRLESCRSVFMFRIYFMQKRLDMSNFDNTRLQNGL
jgi:hypothetical protein